MMTISNVSILMWILFSVIRYGQSELAEYPSLRSLFPRSDITVKVKINGESISFEYP